MINLELGIINQGGNDFKINSWEVWFRTPFGITCSLGHAISAVKEKDLDPELTIEPIAVAIHDENIYEVK